MESLFAMMDSIQEMSLELRDHLHSILEVQYLRRKDYLLKAGQISRRVCFVKGGLLRCYYSIETAEISSWFMKEGDIIFSVESFLLQQPSHESIQALENVTIFFIGYSELQNIYKKFPEFNFIGRVLTEKYYVQSEQRIRAMRMQRSSERYNNLMVAHPDLILRVPAKHLASYLGVSEVTLSKTKSRKIDQKKL